MPKKILVQDGLIKYEFDEDVKLEILDDKIITPDFIIGDLNINNSSLHRNINNLPQDFEGELYSYNAGNFVRNNNWKDYKKSIEDARLEKLRKDAENEKR